MFLAIIHTITQLSIYLSINKQRIYQLYFYRIFNTSLNLCSKMHSFHTQGAFLKYEFLDDPV